MELVTPSPASQGEPDLAPVSDDHGLLMPDRDLAWRVFPDDVPSRCLTRSLRQCMT